MRVVFYDLKGGPCFIWSERPGWLAPHHAVFSVLFHTNDFWLDAKALKN